MGDNRHPPRPRPGFTIAVTGHRLLEPAQAERLAAALPPILAAAAEGARAGGAGAVSMLSQLAAGADQIAADAALAAGLSIAAILPFPKAEFAADFEGDDRARFDALIARAELWSLPCARAEQRTAYALAGSLMLGQSDLLLALWDGGIARGPGGTALVVDEAIRRGIPVVHLSPDGDAPRLIWSSLAGAGAAILDSGSAPSGETDPDAIRDLARRLVAPPANEAERAALDDYLAEREQRLRWRPEYPLLLAVTGVRRMTRGNLRVAAFADSTRDEWAPFRAALDGSTLRADGLDRIERAFCWADRLADHYAQVYRGGVILNYAFAALAVLVALVGIVAPDAKPLLLSLELLLIGSLILNTRIGNRDQWHRRWLDYRFLAERLRPMRSLKLLGASSPSEAWMTAGSGRWTEWYAAALWREAGLPPSIADAAETRRLSRLILEQEVRPQIAYNRVNAHRMHLLDHRLHKAGSALFVTTVAAAGVGLVGYLLAIPAVLAAGKWLTVIGAALPTLGSALFGIRGQSDFAGAARRAAATADKLDRTARRLEGDPLPLAVATRAAEDAAQMMAADLGQWRTSFEDKKLAIPA